MIVWSWSLLVAVHFLLTVGNCQWMVDVFLYRFENKYNAEINDDQFCCCDTKDEEKVNFCAVDLSMLPNDCTNKCDTWFEVSIAPCGATDGLRCTVSTKSERIKDSPSVGDYGYVFQLTSDARPENLTIDTKEEDKGDNSEIDRFTVTLSLVAANQITSYTGYNNITVIQLSYQIHCLNLDDCPSNYSISQLMNIEAAKPTLCENMSTAHLMSSVNNNLECSSNPQLLESERSQKMIWMAFAIFFLLLALAMTVVTILISILHFKKYFQKIMKSDSEVKSKEAVGGCNNLMYEPNLQVDAFSSQQESNGAQDPYREFDNTLYGPGSASAYVQKGPIEKEDEGVYELTTPGEIDANNFYEIPVP